jgi:threonine dehydrogenase-like Zn-dependent dehydrogenase
LQASKEDHELAAELFRKIPDWLEKGKLKPNKIKLLRGGLSGVEEGFQLHRDGKISGFKVVYEL